MHASLGLRALNANGATSSDPYAGDDYLVHFCQVAALVITLYDHLITLDREVEYSWSRRWSKSKALFILARYFGDLLLITDCFVFLNRDAVEMDISRSRRLRRRGIRDFRAQSSRVRNACP
ncbi:hypothetical protein M413DRAFT_295249 [Hebeloma cylindrosporum]|uniref:DUF6533 domain-containing protein n=1 Tax=Hebeloma cylindrosporum TaxID=76867 RepID=A0A0C2Y7K8_HEBCY|nr:hypothetical protein M413DRAFT_295249 [Hebeloma cylindrosporum h7]